MIFDNDAITILVIQWQNTGDDEVLDKILAGTVSLVEAIVSGFDYEHRDDLIQESLLRVQHSLVYYNPDKASLHNYLTTVIRNICVTYLTKQSREPNIPLDVEMVGEIDNPKIDDYNVLSDMVARNRQRFPSIPVKVIDDMTEHIYYSLINNGLSKRVVSKLCEEFDCNRSLAGIVYNSTLVYLRMRFIGYAKQPEIDEEFSLAPDLRELIGNKATNRVMLAFSGITIKVP